MWTVDDKQPIGQASLNYAPLHMLMNDLELMKTKTATTTTNGKQQTRNQMNVLLRMFVCLPYDPSPSIVPPFTLCFFLTADINIHMDQTTSTGNSLGCLMTVAQPLNNGNTLRL